MARWDDGPRWTDEQVVAALAAYQAQHGRWPTMGEWRASGALPSVSLIAKRLGWRNALRLAGGESRKVSHCRHGHELRGDNVLIRSGGERRCRTCARAEWRAAAARRRLRVGFARTLRDPRAADLLPTYAPALMVSTVAHLQRLGPDELAVVVGTVDDELAEAARHLTQLVALREPAKRLLAERAEQSAVPTPERRMAIAAGAATASPGRPRGRGASSPR